MIEKGFQADYSLTMPTPETTSSHAVGSYQDEVSFHFQIESHYIVGISGYFF